MAEEEITIHLTLTSVEGSPRVPLKISKDVTAADLLTKISTETKIQSAKVIFRGRLIKSADTGAVAEYKLEEGSVLHCMGKPANSNEPTAAAVAPASLPNVSLLPNSAPAVTQPPATNLSDPVQAALSQMRSQLAPAVYQTAVTTLKKVLSNITDNPLEEKFRRIKKSNATFNRRLGSLAGAREAILACGFIETEEMYEMQATPEAWPALLETLRKVTVACTPPSAPAALGNAGGLGGLPGMDAFAGMGGLPGMGGSPGMGGLPGMPPNIPPQMQQAVRNMLSDPAQVQRMLQDPTVQAMLQNDPMARQMLDQMQNMTPEQMAQMSQLIGVGGMAGPGLQPSAAPSVAPGGSSGAPPANDSSQTEDEMIAEAIRRSLEDRNNDNNGSS